LVRTVSLVLAIRATSEDCLTVPDVDGPNGTTRTVRDVWLSLETDDAATFQQLLANSALHLDRRQNGRPEPIETLASMQFQTRAIRSLQVRLVKNSIITNGMISAVTALMGYEVRHEHLSRGLL
jgi:hypothetical protein